MKCIFSIFLLLSILISCSLNSDQEASLNQHLSKYIQARNGCMMVGIVGFTHPEYIRELKNQGDSVLLKKMDCNQNFENGTFYSDPTLRKVKAKDDRIHVYYEVDVSQGRYGTPNRRAEGMYAISEDKGKTWFFLPKDIYTDTAACKPLERLIEN